MFEVHPSARISPLADIERSIRGTRIIIEANVVIDSFVKIKATGGMGDLVIGANTVINSGCVIYTGNGINIGKNCAIAANSTFAATNHEYCDKTLLINEQGFKKSKGGITISDDVWIGSNCTILDGAKISSGCVIAAQSLVRGSTTAYKVYGGIPLKLLGSRK